MDFLPQYDELWVVSDLHMGGERSGTKNFQILRHGDRLARFIRRLAKDSPGEEVALVLNGDIIDSLAEDAVPGYVALDLDTALAMMTRICDDAAFRDVWNALGEFVHTAQRHLIFILGNHDLELALEPVQAWIRKRLADGDAAAAARIVFSTLGSGFACRVGNRRVFCTHGNEVDEWNTVDYSALGQLGNALNAGRRVDATKWTPNAGTRLVIDLMNEVKKRFPFVDLLKPETKPVLSALLTLDPSLVKLVDFGPAYKVVRDLVRGQSEVKNLLGGRDDVESVPPATLAAAALDNVIGPNLAEGIRGAEPDGENDMLLKAEGRVGRRIALEAADGGTLGWTDIVGTWFGRLTPAEGLRRALQDWLAEDTTFELTDRDLTFTRIIERVGPGVDVVVTGHTHLARAIEFEAGRHYFNCGTWIRLLRLTPEALATAEKFEPVFKALGERSMSALDALKIPGNGPPVLAILDRTNAVRVAADAAPSLQRVVDSADGTSVGFQVEKGGADS